MKSILATSVLFFALSTGLSQAKDTFTISWWGYNGDKLNANIIEPFKKICDCDIVFETGNNADRLNKLAVRNGKGVDVVFLTDSFSQSGIEQGLFQKVDRSKIPNVTKLWDLAQAPQGDYGPAYTIGRVSIVYDSDQVEPITSWNDLWRKDLANSVSLPGITTTAGPMMVLRAGAHADVDAYTDPDAAFAALEEMKPNIVKNYKTGSEMVNLFSTGEVTVAVAQDFTFASLKEAVPSMVNAELSDGDIATLNTINIPKGAEHVDLAHEFINFVLSTPIQEVEAKQGVDAPVNKEVVLTPEEAANWTYGEDEISSLNRINYDKLNAAKVDWIDRWNEIFGS